MEKTETKKGIELTKRRSSIQASEKSLKMRGSSLKNVECASNNGKLEKIEAQDKNENAKKKSKLMVAIVLLIAICLGLGLGFGFGFGIGKTVSIVFNTAGGSEIDSIVSKLNKTLVEPTAPTKAGHKFDGWYKDESLTAKWDFEVDKVSGDTTLFAKWISNKCTILFLSDGHNFENVKVEHGSKLSAPTPPTKDGHKLDGWYKDESLTEKWDFEVDKVSGDTTLFAKWILNKCTITFVSEGNNFESAEVEYGSKLSAPPPPTKQSTFQFAYTFTKWYTDETFAHEYDFESIVTNSFSLYAQFSSEDILLVYTLSANGSSYLVTGIKDKNITSLIVPNKFKGKQVTSIQLGNKVGTVEEFPNLTELTIPFVGREFGGSVATHFGAIFSEGKGAIENSFCVPISLKKVHITGGTSIKEMAFWSTTNIESIILPETLTEIGSEAFMRCGIKSIVIPASVTTIVKKAFRGAGGITSVKVADGNIKYRAECNCIIDNNNCVVEGFNNSVIPDDVTSIGADAFNAREGLSQITIPSGITSIGDGAFKTTGLKSIHIPIGVKTIGKDVFLQCSKLLTITCGAIKKPLTWSESWIGSGCVAVPTWNVEA